MPHAAVAVVEKPWTFAHLKTMRVKALGWPTTEKTMNLVARVQAQNVLFYKHVVIALEKWVVDFADASTDTMPVAALVLAGLGVTVDLCAAPLPSSGVPVQ